MELLQVLNCHMDRIRSVLFSSALAVCLFVSSASGQEVKSQFTIEQYNDFEAIFVGQIKSIQEVENGFYLRIVFKPSKVFKGAPTGDIVVHTPSQRTHGCGIKATTNAKWLIFADEDPDKNEKLITSYCVGSTQKVEGNSTLEEVRVLSEQAGGYYEWKYANGKVGGKGEMINGKPTGPWEYFYEDGYLKSQGSYIDGLKEGEWTYYAPSRRLYRMNNDLSVLKNIMDSLWLVPSAAEHLSKSGNYVLEPVYIDPTTKEQYGKQGEIKAKSTYKNGKLDGVLVSYHDNGQVEREENYINGKRHGTFTSYYPNGTKSREGTYSQGLPRGRWVDYNKNGTVRHEAMDAIPAYRATKDGMVPVTDKKGS